MFETIAENYLQDVRAAFENYKKLAEKSSAQVSDEEFFRPINAESNSIAVIVKHLSGNLRSRWTRFLTTDGEKPDRNRDAEFVAENDSRESLMQLWENGWRILLETLESLRAEDLAKTVQIRGEDFTVLKATNRALAHAAYHVGQITFLAKHFRASEWKTLSIPRSELAEFNDYLRKQDGKANYLAAPQDFVNRKS